MTSRDMDDDANKEVKEPRKPGGKARSMNGAVHGFLNSAIFRSTSKSGSLCGRPLCFSISAGLHRENIQENTVLLGKDEHNLWTAQFKFMLHDC